jgi:hypothetical protein
VQLHLPLSELTGPPPMAWEQLAPDQRVAAVAVLSRLMARAVCPPTKPDEQEEVADD